MAPLLAACSGPYSTLDPAGPAAELAALLWWGMFAVSVVVMVVVCGLWWHAMGRYAHQLDEATEKRQRDRWIIWGGIVLPSVSIAVLLAFGIPAGHRMQPHADTEREVLHVHVEARRWYWHVSYPDYGIELIDEIHIPVDTPVNFHIASADVIHAFWVPRLGGKVDAIPGRTNVLRLEASEAGQYGGLCAEFCGTGHAHMGFEVTAHSEADFIAWAERQAAESEAEADDDQQD